MGNIKLKDGIYSIGCLNPDLRVFDIVMETKYGTTYNAYMVKGSEKIALIDNVHYDFYDEYVNNINELTSFDKIDYIILNHTEPDHTGSVRYLLEKNPNIVLYGTMAAAKNIEAITNMKVNMVIVKDGDTLDLGGKTLKFIVAPNLHWPDSMFTFVESDKLLFSCDFLGAHLCDAKMFDSSISDMSIYDYTFKHYFDSILHPFKPYVLSGLSKIENLDIDMVCPSHGPILIDRIKTNIKLYKEWSTPATKDKKIIAIAYSSAYGYTRALANAAKEALIENNFEVDIYDIIEYPLAEITAKINASDAFLIGSPTINRDAVPPVWYVVAGIDAITNIKKPCGVFGSFGWSGEAVPALKDRLAHLRLSVIGDGFKVNFKPTDDDLETMKKYALEVATNIK